MPMIRRWLFPLLALWLAVPVAQAQRYDEPPRGGYNQLRDPRAERPGHAPHSRDNGLAAAVAEAQRRTGGRVLSAEPRDDGEGRYYRIKVLTPDGRVRILQLGDR